IDAGLVPAADDHQLRVAFVANEVRRVCFEHASSLFGHPVEDPLGATLARDGQRDAMEGGLLDLLPLAFRDVPYHHQELVLSAGAEPTLEVPQVAPLPHPPV